MHPRAPPAALGGISPPCLLEYDHGAGCLQPRDGRYVQGVTPLADFEHPADAIYLFGGDNANLNDEDDLGGRVPDAIVYIPTAEANMYSWVAAACVFYDRAVKRG